MPDPPSPSPADDPKPAASAASAASRAAKATNREARIQRVLEEMERTLREQMPQDEDPQTLEQIEETAERVGEALKERLQREIAEQQGRGFAGTTTRCPACGKRGAARYAGEQARQVVTRHGVLRLSRAYYHCRTCKRGFCPLDRQLLVGRGQLSSSVVALASRFATYLSFRQAARELELVCGIRLSASTLQRYATAVGRQMHQADFARQVRVERALERGDARAVSSGRPA
jgi:hypothetical protein